jgi:hypothetical protein
MKPAPENLVLPKPTAAPSSLSASAMQPFRDRDPRQKTVDAMHHIAEAIKILDGDDSGLGKADSPTLVKPLIKVYERLQERWPQLVRSKTETLLAVRK